MRLRLSVFCHHFCPHKNPSILYDAPLSILSSSLPVAILSPPYHNLCLHFTYLIVLNPLHVFNFHHRLYCTGISASHRPHSPVISTAISHVFLCWDDTPSPAPQNRHISCPAYLLLPSPPSLLYHISDSDLLNSRISAASLLLLFLLFQVSADVVSMVLYLCRFCLHPYMSLFMI